MIDPFIGSGTVGLAAIARGCSIVGIEQKPEYFATAVRRIEKAIADAASAKLCEAI